MGCTMGCIDDTVLPSQHLLGFLHATRVKKTSPCCHASRSAATVDHDAKRYRDPSCGTSAATVGE